VSPLVVAPNADGSGDTSTVAFTLSAPAQVTAQVLDAGGNPLVTLYSATLPAGPASFQWAAHVLVDGRYRLLVEARAPSSTKTASRTIDFVVDRTLLGLQESPAAISPNADGVNDSTTLSFTLAQDVPVRVDLVHQGVLAGTVYAGQPGIGQHTLVFDGHVNGGLPPDGAYQLVVTVTDALGDVQTPLSLAIDLVPPTLTLVDLATLRFSLNEPATVTAVVNGATRIVQAEPKGTFALAVPATVTSVSAVAEDAAGNVSPVVSAGG
jgi:hypothetical protein